MSEYSFELSIPTDTDGYVLMQCPLCCEMFKLHPHDVEDDAVFDIRCPCCGIVSDNYITDDVAELAVAKAGNIFLDEMHKEMKKLERETRGGVIQFVVGKKPKHEFEKRLMPTIEAMSETVCEECGKSMKLTHALLFTAYCCPYCGVSNFNER